MGHWAPSHPCRLSEDFCYYGAVLSIGKIRKGNKDMASMKQRLWTGSVLCAVWFLTVGPMALGDTITVDGKTYTDVLIYKSSGSYYIKIPTEGRVLNATFDKVDEASVEIVPDPYYRDELKQKYDKSRRRRLGQKPLEDSRTFDPAFLVSGGGGGGKGGVRGLGMPRTVVQSMIAGMGVSFTPTTGPGGVPAFMGALPGGGATLTLEGPDDKLTGITISRAVTKKEMKEFRQDLVQIKMLTAGVSPWAGEWLIQTFPTIRQTGFAEATQDGVNVTATFVEGAKNSYTFEFTIRSL